MAGSRATDGTSVAEWEKLAKVGQPIIVYMPMANLADIMAAFARGGLAPDTPAAIISSSSMPQERVIETTSARAAAEAAKQEVGSPAIVIVGAIAAVRQQLVANMVGRS